MQVRFARVLRLLCFIAQIRGRMGSKQFAVVLPGASGKGAGCWAVEFWELGVCSLLLRTLIVLPRDAVSCGALIRSKATWP